MQTTSHSAVLQALISLCATYVNGKKNTDAPLHAWTIDESGTLDTSALDTSIESEIVEKEIRESSSIAIPVEALRIHSFAPPKKAEGIVRLIYENVNGIKNQLSNNNKVNKMQAIHDDLEVNLAAYCKHKLNMKHKRSVNGFNQLFKGGKSAIQSITAHNVHENVGWVQQGGTSLILFGHLSEQLNHNESGKVPMGLERWTVMTFEGDGVRTWFLCGYNPCGNNKLNSGMSYQQQKRFFVTTHKNLTCPRKHFHDDLISHLLKWRKEGDRLVVCVDANEHIYKESIGRSLTDWEGLNMREVVGEFTGTKLGPTSFRGSKPIDGIWAVEDIVVTHACIMPIGFGVGNHHIFIVDFQESSLVGTAPFRVQCAISWRLNTKVLSGATRNYVERLEKSISKHPLIEKLSHPTHQEKGFPAITQ